MLSKIFIYRHGCVPVPIVVGEKTNTEHHCNFF